MATKYVTKSDCSDKMGAAAAQRTVILSEIATIRRALIGEDLRGGLVKDVEKLNGKVDQIAENGKNSATLLNRWKIAAAGFVVSLTIAIIGLASRFV